MMYGLFKIRNFYGAGVLTYTGMYTAIVLGVKLFLFWAIYTPWEKKRIPE